jgi:tetratricopeptide (TPR) repeat protein
MSAHRPATQLRNSKSPRRRTAPAAPVLVPAPAETRIPEPAPFDLAFFVQTVLLVVATFAAYWSSLGNHYALDDRLLIERNASVLRGVSGIGEILTTHIYQSYFEGEGGDAPRANRHYRPLPVITYALEQSLFGRTPGDEYRALREEWHNPSTVHAPGALEERMVEMERRIDDANLEIAFERHFVQVTLFAMAMVALFVFLTRSIFPAIPFAGFIATLLYALHPIHTEVVANVKSRDEILSLLFILLTGVFVFAWDRTRRPLMMGLAMASLALALLSKEYAVLAPPMFAAALMLVRGRKLRPLLVSTVLPLLAVVALYLVVRGNIIGPATAADNEPLDLIVDPFLKLRTGEAEGSILATKIDALDHNLRLLVWPHPLSADYSYAAFSYRTFASPHVWVSILAHVAIAVLTFLAWRRRHVLAFAGILYLGFHFLVQIGAFLGERLAFHSSLGFALLLGWAIARLRPAIALAVCLAVALPYGTLSFLRNPAWKNDRTLFFTDVKTVPNACLVNGKVGAAILDESVDRLAERKKQKRSLSAADRDFVRDRAANALVYLRRAVNVHPGYAGAWANIGIAHYFREEFARAGEAFARAAEINDGLPTLRHYAANFHLLGTALAKSGDLDGAREMFRRAAAASPRDVRHQSAHGATALMTLRFAEARDAFWKALRVENTNPQAMQGFAAASAYERMQRATVLRPDDPAAFEQFALALDRYPQPPFAAAARKARERAAILRSAPPSDNPSPGAARHPLPASGARGNMGATTNPVPLVPSASGEEPALSERSESKDGRRPDEA